MLSLALVFTLILSVLLIYIYRILLRHIVFAVCYLVAKVPGVRSVQRLKVLLAVGMSFAMFAPLVAVTGVGNAVGMANIAAHLIFALVLWLGIERGVGLANKILGEST